MTLPRENLTMIRTAGDRDRFRDVPGLVGGEIGIPLGHFLAGLVGEPIDQVIGLHAETFRPETSNRRAIGVRTRVVAELTGRRMRQRHHLMRIVNRVGRLFVIAERGERLLHQLLQVRLARIDDVADP